MNIFDLFKELFFKIKTVDCRNSEGMQLFIPFMINRWLSFYSKAQTLFVNECLNKYSNVIDDKMQMYNMYYNLIPKMHFKKIPYVKKVKDNPEKEIEHLALIASNLNISTREIKQNIEIYNNLKARTL